MEPALSVAMVSLLILLTWVVTALALYVQKKGVAFQEDYITPAMALGLSAGMTTGLLLSEILKLARVEVDTFLVACQVFILVFIPTLLWWTRRGYVKARLREVATRDETTETQDALA